MPEDSWLSILLIIVLLLMGAYFASSEIALSSVNRVRIRLLADRGDKGARNVQYILDHFDRALSTILIGNNLSHILASSTATLMAARLWGTSAVAATTLVLTVIVFFFAELLPKTIAKKYSERFSQAVSGSLILIMRICTPFSVLLTAIGNAAASLLVRGGDSVTEDEFHDMVENIAEEGSLESEKGELVQSALSFSDRTVGEILTARVDVDAIEDTTPPQEIITFIKSIRHSRIPVYHETIDNVVGILSCRRYVKAYLKDGDSTDLQSVMDPPFFIHESTEIADLLPAMNRRKATMAVVTDDYGGVAGVITVEDALEEIVGDIWDEDDEVVESCVQVNSRTWDVDASLTMEACFQRIGYEPGGENEEEEEDLSHRTMVSLALTSFDAIPHEGDSFDWKDLKITVLRMDRRRILTLRIERKEADAQ